MRLAFRIRSTPSDPSRGAAVDRRLPIDVAAAELTIGRRAGADLVLPFETISARHARLVRRGNGWAVVDLGSANGTFADGRRLPPHLPHPLVVGRPIRLADVSLALESIEEAPPRAGAESTATLARRIVADLFRGVPSTEVARLVFLPVPGAPRQAEASEAASPPPFVLIEPDRPYRVGRAPDCDLVLADDDASRYHASFERRWDGVFARDLGSKNGLFVDTERVTGERRLRDGETVVLGGTRLRFDDPEERYLRELETDDPPPAESPRALVDRPGAPAVWAGEHAAGRLAGAPPLPARPPVAPSGEAMSPVGPPIAPGEAATPPAAGAAPSGAPPSLVAAVGVPPAAATSPPAAGAPLPRPAPRPSASPSSDAPPLPPPPGKAAAGGAPSGGAAAAPSSAAGGVLSATLFGATAVVVLVGVIGLAVWLFVGGRR